MGNLLHKMLFFLPLMLLVMVVNYFVDPARLFSNGDYETGIAKLLLSGKNVAEISNHDERVLQRVIIENLQKKIDVVVLGSSRVMQIGYDYLHSGNLLNSSVSGASLEDLMAIYEMYRAKRLVPSKIYVGLEPWMLNRNSGQAGYLSVVREYNNSLLSLGRVDPKCFERGIMNGPLRSYARKLFQLISPSYFQDSVKQLLLPHHGKYYPTDNEFEKEMVKLRDGSITYPITTRDVDVLNVRVGANNYSKKPVYALEGFSELDATYQKIFEEFVGLIRNDGVEIVFVLVPYHPLSYDKLMQSEKYKIIGDVETYYRGVARDRGEKIVGSFDPKRCALDEYDFYDGMHPKRTAMGKILACE